MKQDVAMRYEIDSADGLATLYFGHREEYVITLGRDNLEQLVNLGAAATKELTDTRLGDD